MFISFQTLLGAGKKHVEKEKYTDTENYCDKY